MKIINILPLYELCDIVDIYKFGIKENPWRDFDKSKLKSALPDFRRRVKGQEQAIIKTLDIVKRAVTGIAGVRASSRGENFRRLEQLNTL